MLIAAAAGRGLWLYRGAVAREIADITVTGGVLLIGCLGALFTSVKKAARR